MHTLTPSLFPWHANLQEMFEQSLVAEKEDFDDDPFEEVRP